MRLQITYAVVYFQETDWYRSIADHNEKRMPALQSVK